MNFFELQAAEISNLNDADLRELVARLCEAEIIQQGGQPSCVTWGGAQEAADGGLDISVKSPIEILNSNFVPRKNTGIQVKKNKMIKSACTKEMLKSGSVKAVIQDLAAKKGAYIIVSGKDDCTEKMLSDRLAGMKDAVSSLKTKDDLFLDFYGQDRLAVWLRRHPSVALWVRSRLGKPLAGWKPYGRWASTPPEQDDQFLVDDYPCVIDANSTLKEPLPITAGIQLTRNKLRNLGSTVRIIGLSGVGKTRFAQALFESDVGQDSLPPSDVIYADLGDDLSPTASELITYLIANDFAAYLVLDNCPPDVHRRLQKQVADSGSKLHLLTIEYDISDDMPEETEAIHLEAGSEKIISNLIQRRFPALGSVNADKIAEFSGGNARVALALSSRVDADETLSKFSDEDLFQRLFTQRKGASEDLFRSAEMLALFYSFNTSPSDFNDELNILGAISAIRRENLYRSQAELTRRQLVQQRGDWRAILPHALANRLAKRALENISLDSINSEIFKTENLRLFQSCAHRLGYLHDFEPARTLALSWIQPGAPLHDLSSCNERYLVALHYVAPVFPDVVLSAIESASLNPEFASRNNDNFINFVRLLCQLAYEDRTFDRVTEVLLKFAESEKNNENNNGIVHQMRQLFSLHLSGTEATPERRQSFIGRLIKSGHARHREIASQLLQSAFEAQHWTSFGDFHFGARKRGWGWIPENDAEALSWYVSHIRLLDQPLSSSLQEDREWAKELLASNFRGLWSCAGCFDALEKIIRTYGKNGKWPKIWLSIKSAIHFDGDALAPEILYQLNSLERITAPSDSYSQIEAYVLNEVWEHVEISDGDFEKASENFYEKVFSLGVLAASQSEYLERLGSKLWTTKTQSFWHFGKGLATGSKDKLGMFNFLVTLFRKHNTEQASIQILAAYIKGIHEESSHQARQILKAALDIPEFQPYSIGLLTTMPIAPWVFRKILGLAQNRQLEAWRFESLGYGRAHEDISDDDLTILLSEINLLDKGYLSTIEILSMRFLQKEQFLPNERLRAVARHAIRSLVSADRDESTQLRMHGIERVFEESFNSTAPKPEIKEVIESLCEGISTYRIYAFDFSKLISALIKQYPEAFLEIVFEKSGKERELTHLFFRDRVGRASSALNDAPLDRILAWCGNDQHRIMKTANAVSVYTISTASDALPSDPKHAVLSSHIKSLMEISSDKLAIVEIIFRAARPDSWSNSLANILEMRAKAFAELLAHPSPEVQSLVRKKLLLLEQSVQREREREAAENNKREQRFE